MFRAEAQAAVPAAGGQRWKLAATLAVTLLVAYYDRLNISLALPLIAREQGWSAAETARYGGLLMSLFYVGYGLANIFLSPLAARFGPRRSLLAIVALWSLFTALGAWLSQILAVFLAARVLLGLAEGVHFPMMNQLTKAWFPSEERSRANSLWISGLFVAVLTAPLVLVPVMDAWGWRTGFVLLSLGGLALSLPLVAWQIHDRPDEHPRASSAERALLREAARREAGDGAAPERARFLTLLRQPAYLLMTAAGILNNMVALGIAGWLPTYLAARPGVQYGDLSYLASVPYATSLAGLAFWGVLGDRTDRRGYHAALGYLACGALVGAALASESLPATLAFFGAATFAVSAFNAAEFAMVQRILPAGRIAAGSGLYNGLTTMLGGGLGPFVVAGIVSGRRDLGAVLPIAALCALASAALVALGRITRY